MLPVHQIPLHIGEMRIIKPALIKLIRQRGEPANRLGQQAATRPQYPPGLAQGLPPVRGVGQVIQRPEQHHRVLRPTGLSEFSRVAHCGGKGSGCGHCPPPGVPAPHAAAADPPDAPGTRC